MLKNNQIDSLLSVDWVNLDMEILLCYSTDSDSSPKNFTGSEKCKAIIKSFRFEKKQQDVFSYIH